MPLHVVEELYNRRCRAEVSQVSAVWFSKSGNFRNRISGETIVLHFPWRWEAPGGRRAAYGPVFFIEGGFKKSPAYLGGVPARGSKSAEGACPEKITDCPKCQPEGLHWASMMNDPADTPNLKALMRVSSTMEAHFLGEAALLNRRTFLHSTFLSGLGFSGLASADPAATCTPTSEVAESEVALTEYERTIANLTSLDLLGRPRSWSLVRQGLHPLSPERVVVVMDRSGDGWPSRDSKREAHLRKRLADLALPAGKLDLILRLMHVLAEHYRAPNLSEPWATGLAKREALGSTGCGLGFGLLHQFQDADDVRLMNPPVDWWLVLFPEGVGWQAPDDQPVYGMIGHVFPPHHRRLPALKLMTYELTSRVGLVVTRTGQEIDLTAWRRIARLDRIAAARTVNLAIARCIGEPAF